MVTPYPLRPGEPDCRDYLRTGRCKYGESCKYNHPPNVESGGGVKPINPSEPLFPIRPSEPACQYFLKHGTCKFGQSCKFNHPSRSILAEGSGGLPTGQLVFVTTNSPGDASSHLMTASTSVQVLPQRPTEPNCIYFLRNGRCKYGATCKFHHPLDSMNRNNQVQYIQTTRSSPNVRDRSQSTGSASEGRSQMQSQAHHNLTYAAPTNLSFVQPQRLQPITERVRPQKPTHILLPDGQIALLLDPQSLQNVTELNAQDRPKFYLSQTDGSIGTLQPMDQNNNPVVISPMLSATTNSTSNQTFDSSLDLGNVSYQGHTQGTQSRKPGSGGSLSAYGSLDSGSQAPGSDFAQQVPSQVHSQQISLNFGHLSFPQYSAWPMNESIEPPNQAQVRRSPPASTDAFDRHHRAAGSNLESTHESTAAHFWPSSGSLPSISATENDLQAPGRPHATTIDSNHCSGSRRAGDRVIHRPHCSESNASLSPPLSSKAIQDMVKTGEKQLEPTGDECEGLNMMTSALLSMMDHHESPNCENEINMRRIPSSNSSQTDSRSTNPYDVVYSQGEPTLGDRVTPVRPPPGMTMSPGLLNVTSLFSSINFSQDLTRSRSPSVGGYFVGGYDQIHPRSPPWGS